MISDKVARRETEYELRREVKGMKPEDRETYLDHIATGYYLGEQSSSASDVESLEHLSRQIPASRARVFH